MNRDYHPANLVELARKIDNLIRLGTIAQVQGDRVRVQTGELTTTWIPWLTSRAGAARSWSQPSVGEQVILLSLSGDLRMAVALPAIYTEQAPAPSQSQTAHTVVFPDGASFEYDAQSGTLKVSGIKKAEINAADSIDMKAGSAINLTAPIVTCSQHFQAQTFSMTGGGAGGATGTITGTLVHSGGSITSNGVTLHSHTHGGVETGNGSTGGPR